MSSGWPRGVTNVPSCLHSSFVEITIRSDTNCSRIVLELFVVCFEKKTNHCESDVEWHSWSRCSCHAFLNTYNHVLYLHSFGRTLFCDRNANCIQNKIQNRTELTFRTRGRKEKSVALLREHLLMYLKYHWLPFTRLSSASLRSRTFQLISLFVHFRASPQFFSFSSLPTVNPSIIIYCVRSVLSSAPLFLCSSFLNFADGFRKRGENV